MDAIGRSMLSAALATLALRAWSRLRRMFQKYRPATVTMACRVERQRGMALLWLKLVQLTRTSSTAVTP